MIKEGTERNIRDDIKAFAENVVQDLETMFLCAGHKLFFGTVMKAFDSFAVTTLGANTDDN